MCTENIEDIIGKKPISKMSEIEKGEAIEKIKQAELDLHVMVNMVLEVDPTHYGTGSLIDKKRGPVFWDGMDNEVGFC